MNGAIQSAYGFLSKKVDENLEIYKQNFDIVLTGEDAAFENIEEILSLSLVGNV